jgi:hypothetical protein
LFHTGGWADGRRYKDRQINMIKLIVPFRNFANTPKNSTFCLRYCKITSPYSVNSPVLITEKACVYCAV